MEKIKQNHYWKNVIWTINLFKHYFAGTLNDRQKEMIENWQPDMEEAASKISLIDSKIIEEHGIIVKKKVFRQLGIRMPKERRSIRRHFAMPAYLKYAAAAAIIFAVIGASLYLFQTGKVSAADQQLLAQTADMETKKVELPDGTLIHLNSNSRIEYIQKEFGKDKREIWLDGEAYFDVAKNPDKPFIIYTNDIQTKVHGTSFNIKAYQSIGEISVTVETGKVEVSSDWEVIGLLTPNRQLVYNERNKMHEISDSDWQDAAAWMEKRLVLRDANADELKLRLQQLYGMTIIIEDDALAGSVLNAAYSAKTTLNIVLQGISEIYDIQYTIDETHKKVRIYK